MNNVTEVVLNMFSKAADMQVSANMNISSLGLDSLSFVQLIVDLEDYFDIEINDEALYLSNSVTVMDYISCISKKYEE